MRCKVFFLFKTILKLYLLPACLLIFLSSCNGQDVRQKQIVTQPTEIDTKAEDIIQNTLKELVLDSALNDSLKIRDPFNVQEVYRQNSSLPLWCAKGVFLKYADSLLAFIDRSKLYGLFPDDYYSSQLNVLHKQLTSDSAQERLDASRWAYSDMLMTSAFIQVVKDLKAGRLMGDSTLLKDTTLTADFFFQQLKSFQQRSTRDFAASLEPANIDYYELKKALQNFLSKANFREYTVVKTKDSSALPRLLYKRLSEEDSLKLQPVAKLDSVTLVNAIKKYQKLKGLKVDGKINSALLKKLNENDKEKFIRVAITLDRYKMMPALPDEYIWVNLPSYYLQVRQKDTVALLSRIVCGKPTTSTPLLTSNITDMITYPQWTIPTSIIKKEILPGLKRDAGYLGRKGYSLLDSKGNEVDPYSVNWAKYTQDIPYKVIQGSGDANALGVLKFNFPNPYSVYLHDTNQRYLFSNTSRALSHGCVRVQEWKKLAYYLLRRDSVASKKATSIDSLNSWLNRKVKRAIAIKKQMPIFIRYFTVEGKEGKLVFYEDIYDDDKKFRDKLFANRRM